MKYLDMLINDLYLNSKEGRLLNSHNACDEKLCRIFSVFHR